MTLSELYKEKRLIEEKVRELVREFEMKTALKIEGFNLLRVGKVGESSAGSLYSVGCDVRLCETCDVIDPENGLCFAERKELGNSDEI